MALLEYHKRLLRKQADDGGPDSTYEQAMSDLADIVIKDRAPLLKQYELGFQLIDKDEDEQKAVGVKVFKIGKQWLFAPIFLIKGKVKGSELLWIKGQDIFVPLSEDWIRYLINKRPAEMGHSVPRNLGQMGVSNPDLRQIIRPPTKWASAAVPLLWKEAQGLLKNDVVPKWQAACRTNPFAKSAYTLPQFLTDAGQPALQSLYAIVEEQPRLLAAVVEFHGDAFTKAVKVAAAKVAAPLIRYPDWTGEELLPERDPLKTGALQTYVFDKELSPEDELLGRFTNDGEIEKRTGPLIKDTRTGDQVSIPYTELAPRQFTNPTETGLYEVLIQPCKYEKCFVAISPRTINGRAQAATLVRLSDKKFVNVHPSKIWVGKKYEDPEWTEFLDGLPGAESVPEHPAPEPTAGPGAWDAESQRSYDILVGPTGDCTAPLKAVGALGDADGGTAYTVEFCRDREDYAPDFPGASHALNTEDKEHPRFDTRGVLNVGTSRGTKIWLAEGNMYIPAGYKKIEVKKPKYGEEFFQLGSPYHATLNIVRKLPKLKVAYQRDQVFVNDQPYKETAALLHLVRDHGLREHAASEILKQAAAKQHSLSPTFTCLVKYADDPYLTSVQRGTPGIPEPYYTQEATLNGSVPGLPQQYMLQGVPDMLPEPSGMSQYDLRMPTQGVPNQSTLQAVQQAAQSGQKEIFDTSMIGGILQTTQQDLQVDKYLGPLMSGLDAIGRILMSLYWHGDDFADRYGKDDVVSLEDMLRNTFINLGKLILNLKQKGVEDPLDTQRDLELETASDQ